MRVISEVCLHAEIEISVEGDCSPPKPLLCCARSFSTDGNGQKAQAASLDILLLLGDFTDLRFTLP